MTDDQARPCLEIPFAIGDAVWWVGNGYQEEYITCPECLGNKTITMVLGNGEEVHLDCAGCSRGYEGPFGVIRRIFYKHVPEKVTLGRVDVSGDRISYSTSGPDANCWKSISAEDLFSSESECEKRCEELNIERTKFEQERDVANLMSRRRDMAWSVHYWRSQVQKLERDLEVAKGRLNRCTERKHKKG